jgi:hypothetical protein
MYCYTTLKIHVIPTAPLETLLLNASALSVDQITNERFGEGAIDGALLKILSQGEHTERLGLRFLPFSQAKAYSRKEELVPILLSVDLSNAPNEFNDYANQYYDTPLAFGVQDAIVHTITRGALNISSEVYISDDKQFPLSSHQELARRHAVEAAHRAWCARH